MSYSISDIKSLLSEHGLKSTSQRIIIYNFLMSTDAHPTAEQTYEAVVKKLPTISLGTVYKTLDTLVDAQLIKRVSSESGSMRYDANTEAHNHIHCTNTKEIIDYEDDELRNVIALFLEKKKIKNLKINNFSLHISGEKIDPKKEISIK